MKLLELFCGTKSIANVFQEHLSEVFTVDFDDRFNPDLCIDVMDLTVDDIPFKPDVVWASPPCQCFSVASISTHWKGGIGAYVPKTEKCMSAIGYVSKTLSLINDLNPQIWFIENPRGVLRKIGVMKELPKYTVTYCRYGDERMKPTDIWTNLDLWIPKMMCHNGDTCHISAPRGAKTGTQGLKGSVERSRLPYDLCDEIYNVCKGVLLS